MYNLFVYGTLLQAENLFGKYLRENSTFAGHGKFPGKLYDLGDYPGAQYNSTINSYVHGSILLLNDTTEGLKLIDEYEGYGSEESQPNEFVRELIDIETKTGLLKCWVYLYNLSVKGWPEIIGGDYLGFIGNDINLLPDQH